MLITTVCHALFGISGFLLILKEELVPLIDEFLFTLYVFEHIVGFWHCNVVREHF